MSAEHGRPLSHPADAISGATAELSHLQPGRLDNEIVTNETSSTNNKGAYCGKHKGADSRTTRQSV
jgi:hypothetical protein